MQRQYIQTLMIATALTLNGVNVNSTYSLTSIVDGKAIRKDATAALGSPKVLTVSHSKRNPKDLESPDRHLVRIDWTKPNSLGVAETVSAYFVVEIPSSATFTSSDVDNVCTQITQFLLGNSGTTFTQFKNGEP